MLAAPPVPLPWYLPPDVSYCANVNTNPNFGYTSFDNFGAASYAIFQMLTLVGPGAMAEGGPYRARNCVTCKEGWGPCSSAGCLPLSALHPGNDVVVGVCPAAHPHHAFSHLSAVAGPPSLPPCWAPAPALLLPRTRGRPRCCTP